MKSQQVDEALDQMQNAMQKLYKVVDKLEQRIATLERVLQSHAKCIGEMRDNLEDMPDEVLVKTWGDKNE
tara:strand:+ start:440 stop:649 length:210 start_codon:yes stop_codon:yes gene_type:complete